MLLFALLFPFCSLSAVTATSIYLLASSSWDLAFRHSLDPAELGMWHRLGTVFSVLSDGMDSIVWPLSSSGTFSVKSAYEARFLGREVSLMAAVTWKSKAPLQCRFFSWLAIRNRCWTSDRLARRGLPHQDTCPLCSQHDETMQHLLIDCSFAKQVWHW